MATGPIGPFATAARRALMLGCGAALVVGCAAAQQPDVERVVAAFATGDPAARCALIAPATLAAVERHTPSCEQAVSGLPGGEPVLLHTAVWGDAAQARTADDTVFLTRTGGGWRIAAVGCSSNGDAPYTCAVEGR